MVIIYFEKTVISFLNNLQWEKASFMLSIYNAMVVKCLPYKIEMRIAVVVRSFDSVLRGCPII